MPQNDLGYTPVDMAAWPRAQHCAAFRSSPNPRWSVAFDLDITEFRHAVHQTGISFTLSFIWTVAHVANQIEAFRYRFVDGDPVLYHRIDPSFTYTRDGEELFRVARSPLRDSLADFLEETQRSMDEQTGFFPEGGRPQDVFLFSALPWISFTHIAHTAPADPDNAAPVFDWGRFQFHPEHEKWIMPFSAEAHHSFVDGRHMGELAAKLQDAMLHPDIRV